jgi:hypothetical protein
VAQIFPDFVTGVDKKLALRFEIAELEDEMHLRGVSVHCADTRFFRRAQIKIELLIFLSESGQPIQVVNLPPGENRQPARVRGASPGAAGGCARSSSDVKVTDGRLVSPFDLF